MRRVRTFVQLSVCNKLYPEANRVIVEADETYVALIKIGTVKPDLSSEFLSLALCAFAEAQGEALVLFQHILFCTKAFLIIDIGQSSQKHIERIFRADKSSRIDKIFTPVRSLGAESQAGWNMQIHQIEQIRDFEIAR